MLPTNPRSTPLRPTRTRTAGAGVVAVVAAGGGVGSLMRYFLGRAIRPAADGFPVATVLINVAGSLLLGALVVAVTDIWSPHHLLRPALGTGVLGGFTTFSSFAFETRGLPAGVALPYVIASLVAGVIAAAAGAALVRRLEPRVRRAEVHEQVDDVDPDLP